MNETKIAKQFGQHICVSCLEELPANGTTNALVLQGKPVVVNSPCDFCGRSGPTCLVRLPAHPVRTSNSCPLCHRAGDMFDCIHVPAPPCFKCRADEVQIVGSREHLCFFCDACGNTWPISVDGGT